MSITNYFGLLLITLSTLHVSYTVVGGDEGDEPRIETVKELVDCIRDKVLKRSNYYRTKYNIESLALDEEMNRMAQDWADYQSDMNVFQHNPENKSYGENNTLIPLMWNVGARVVDLWYSCIAYVNVNDDESKLFASENLGAMTQLLSPLSRKIGVGMAENIKRTHLYVVVYYSSKGDNKDLFSHNLHQLITQNDINYGKNELKLFDLGNILISNSERKSSTDMLKNDQDTGVQEPASSGLTHEFNSSKEIKGLGAAEASRIRDQVFKKANIYREKHGLKTFEITEQLNDVAQERANGLALTKEFDDMPSDTPLSGESLYKTSPTVFGDIGEITVDVWYNQIGYIERNIVENDFFGPVHIGNMTNLLWKASTSIGVGVAVDNIGYYYIVAKFNPTGSITKDCEENLPKFKSDDFKLGAEANEKFTKLMRAKTTHGTTNYELD